MKPPRVHAPRIEAAIDMELHWQMELGVVEVSDGDNGVQVHPVTKPDSESGYRFTLDMCSWNPGLVLDPCPLPVISDILTTLRTGKYFAKMDYAMVSGSFLSDQRIWRRSPFTGRARSTVIVLSA